MDIIHFFIFKQEAVFFAHYYKTYYTLNLRYINLQYESTDIIMFPTLKKKKKIFITRFFFSFVLLAVTWNTWKFVKLSLQSC